MGRAGQPRAQALGKSTHPRTWGITHAPTLKGSGRSGQQAISGDMDAQTTSPEMPKLPAPPCQGGHPGLPRFPGLAPWAFLPDPCGVLLSFPDLGNRGRTPDSSMGLPDRGTKIHGEIRWAFLFPRLVFLLFVYFPAADIAVPVESAGSAWDFQTTRQDPRS